MTGGTFEVGAVDGRNETLDVECHRKRTELRFEANVEMTIPSAWGACFLTIRGLPDTTFTLYEFLEPAHRTATR